MKAAMSESNMFLVFGVASGRAVTRQDLIVAGSQLKVRRLDVGEESGVVKIDVRGQGRI